MPAAGQRLLHHHLCRSNTNARPEQQHLLRQRPSSGGSLLFLHLPLRRHRGPSPAATRSWQLPASTSSTPTPTTPAAVTERQQRPPTTPGSCRSTTSTTRAPAATPARPTARLLHLQHTERQQRPPTTPGSCRSPTSTTRAPAATPARPTARLLHLQHTERQQRPPTTPGSCRSPTSTTRAPAATPARPTARLLHLQHTERQQRPPTTPGSCRSPTSTTRAPAATPARPTTRLLHLHHTARRQRPPTTPGSCRSPTSTTRAPAATPARPTARLLHLHHTERQQRLLLHHRCRSNTDYASHWTAISTSSPLSQPPTSTSSTLPTGQRSLHHHRCRSSHRQLHRRFPLDSDLYIITAVAAPTVSFIDASHQLLVCCSRREKGRNRLLPHRVLGLQALRTKIRQESHTPAIKKCTSSGSRLHRLLHISNNTIAGPRHHHWPVEADHTGSCASILTQPPRRPLQRYRPDSPPCSRAAKHIITLLRLLVCWAIFPCSTTAVVLWSSTSTVRSVPSVLPGQAFGAAAATLPVLCSR